MHDSKFPKSFSYLNMNSNLSIRSILAIPAIYNLFSKVVGGKNGRRAFVAEHIRAKPQDRVLDIGCGPGSVLEFLPDVEYVGFDMSSQYIEDAKKRFGDRGQFYCSRVSQETAGESCFDIVIASGVVHHLDDTEAIQLFELAKTALKPGGRLITLDGCYIAGQSVVAKYILSKDRGEFVRRLEDYQRIARQVFQDVKPTIRHDLLKPIPYTHLIMECTR